MRTAIIGGVRPDGRRLILMPWQDYANLTAQDADAVVNFLQNVVPAVSNEVPAAAVAEEFQVFVE